MILVEDFEGYKIRNLLLSQYNKDLTINVRAFSVADVIQDKLSYLMEIRDDNGKKDGDFTYEKFEDLIYAVNFWINR